MVLSQAVALGEDLVASGETDARSIVTAMTDHIAAEPLARVDYVSAVDGETMEPVDQIRGRGSGGAGGLYWKNPSH